MSGFLKMKSSVDGGDVDDSCCYMPVYAFSFEIPLVLVYDKRGTEMDFLIKTPLPTGSISTSFVSLDSTDIYTASKYLFYHIPTITGSQN